MPASTTPNIPAWQTRQHNDSTPPKNLFYSLYQVHTLVFEILFIMCIAYWGEIHRRVNTPFRNMLYKTSMTFKMGYIKKTGPEIPTLGYPLSLPINWFFLIRRLLYIHNFRPIWYPCSIIAIRRRCTTGWPAGCLNHTSNSKSSSGRNFKLIMLIMIIGLILIEKRC